MRGVRKYRRESGCLVTMPDATRVWSMRLAVGRLTPMAWATSEVETPFSLAAISSMKRLRYFVTGPSMQHPLASPATGDDSTDQSLTTSGDGETAFHRAALILPL